MKVKVLMFMSEIKFDLIRKNSNLLFLLCFIMPPTSKKLTGHIGFGLSICPCPCGRVRSSRFLMHAISYEPYMLGF